MSEDFKVGDRVKVEFEAEITDHDDDGTWRIQPEPADYREIVYISPERMTKLGPPLPTKVGTVIDSNRFRFILTRNGWHATVDHSPYQPGEFEESIYAKNFTVVLEG